MKSDGLTNSFIESESSFSSEFERNFNIKREPNRLNLNLDIKKGSIENKQ